MSVSSGSALARVPERRDCVLRDLLERQAIEHSDALFVQFDMPTRWGTQWTYSQCLVEVQRMARGLMHLGVKQGDSVLCWTANSANAMVLWFAANYLGAVYVPINSHYRGTILDRVISDSGARLMAMDPSLAAHCSLPEAIQDIIYFDGEALAPAHRARSTTVGALLDASTGVSMSEELVISPWATQSVIYTSGTTGFSKGVLSSYAQLHSVVDEPYAMLRPDDCYLCNLPLFHVGGMLPVYAMLIRGGSVVMGKPFRTEAFWPTIERNQVTVCTLLSGMATLLMKQPARADDRGHSLRLALVIPFSDAGIEFPERFGVQVFTIYHMTEICAPLVSDLNPQASGLCGRPRSGVEVRLADSNDCEVGTGEVGELLVRAEKPWVMSHGYLNNPEATAQAWRNGWFHTGDAFRSDDEGNYFFVDRLKDVIRRRGENISSFEVEREFCAHLAVQDAAALAVPDPHGEDEVLVVVEPKPGEIIDFKALLAFVVPRLPSFMVPRYLVQMASLPRTPTGKVQKYELRSRIDAASAWDRNDATATTLGN